ncbi:MAG: hypothetical protein LKI24_11095 [Acidipropionibacterium sp.]|nr:hypothetical protein [Acidipropionibacterium sp.]
MSRTPKVSPPDLETVSLHRAGYTTLIYKAETITPYIGGSPISGKTSEIARPSAVANSIRKWWRVCQADKYRSAASLWEAESELWGSSEEGRGGRCSVFTETTSSEDWTVDVSRRADGKVIRYDPFPPVPPYAVFPWASRDTLNANHGTLPARCNLKFTIRITAPISDISGIKEAIRAYRLFGGYGQRANRGFGSLNIYDTHGGFLSFPKPHMCESESKATGISSSIYLWTENGLDPMNAWNEAVRVYAEFNQGEGFARNIGHGNKPGQSLFPEADTVRRMTNAHDHNPNRIPVNGFPRADLGLPRIFEFPSPRGGPDTPPKSTLQGSRDGHSRYESPVVTKVFQQQFQRDNSVRTYAMIAIMDSPHVWEDSNTVELKITRGGTRDVTSSMMKLDSVTPAQWALMPPLDGHSARDALVQYLNGIQEWQRVRIG